jgi:hypothetical protein
MVFTGGQTTAFFENVDQMGIPHATVIQLVEEGIDEVQDLAEFDRDTLTQVADNLRRPEVVFPTQTLLLPQEPLLLNRHSALALKHRSVSSQPAIW